MPAGSNDLRQATRIQLRYGSARAAFAGGIIPMKAKLDD
jgi:hypothetical protein